MRTLVLLGVTSLAALPVGCAVFIGGSQSGGTTSGGGGTTTSGTTAGTGGTSGTTGSTSSGSSAGACPAAEPVGGASCAGVPSGTACSYGDSVRVECRDVWTCTGGIWSTAKSVCPMPDPGVCGTSEPPAGTQCATEGDVCTYGDTICICSLCPSGPCMVPPAKWSCSEPPTTAGCPQVAPNEGVPCSMDGLACTYGFPCGGSGTNAVCAGGAWTWQSVACPG